MCGRYASSRGAEELIAYFGATSLAPATTDLPRIAPSWNVAPTADIYVILDSQRALMSARWGLIPQWAKSLDFSAKTINARVETVAAKPSFRSAFKSRRAIIPADGYYEWYTAGGPISRKQPFYIHHRNNEPLAMAGLYEWWSENDGSKPILTATVITRPATSQIAEIHNRMPLLLPRESWDGWLSTSLSDQETLFCLSETLLELDAHPVSSRVNMSRQNGATLIDPVPVEMEQMLW